MMLIQDVVWDWKNKRWYMATHMSAAISKNKVGKLLDLRWDTHTFAYTIQHPPPRGPLTFAYTIRPPLL